MSDLSLQGADTGTGSPGGVQWDAWAAALGGYAIGSWVDREFNRPQMAYDQSNAYFLGEDGTLYAAGRPASNVGIIGASSFGLSSNQVLLFALIAAGVYFATKG